MKSVRCIFIAGIILLSPVIGIVSGAPFAGFADGEHTDTCFSGPVVLVTGFEPFDTHEINPSQIVAETLDGQEIDGANVIGIILPVDFNESVAVVTQAIEEHDPVIVISIGLNARARSIQVEKIGLNLKRVRSDNGKRFVYRRIDPCGPFVRFSSLPTRCIARELRKAGIPARQSFFAGTYVCNALLYDILGYINTNELLVQAGFIHVPLLSFQDPRGMNLDTMVEAAELAITVSLQEL